MLLLEWVGGFIAAHGMRPSARQRPSPFLTTKPGSTSAIRRFSTSRRQQPTRRVDERILATSAQPSEARKLFRERRAQRRRIHNAHDRAQSPRTTFQPTNSDGEEAFAVAEYSAGGPAHGVGNTGTVISAGPCENGGDGRQL